MTIKVQVYDNDGNEILAGGENPTGDLKAPTRWEAGRKYTTQQLGRSVAGSASLRILNIESKWDAISRGNRVLISVNNIAQWGGYVDRRAQPLRPDIASIGTLNVSGRWPC